MARTHAWGPQASRFQRTLGWVVIVIGAVAGAHADTIHVNGSCGNDAWTGASSVCSAPNGPKLTIQAGIDASVNGDTVLVADGVYMGVGNKNLDYGGRAIRVLSEGGPEVCIIDCENDGRGFYFHNGETADSVLEGVKIQNGLTARGGAVLCEMGSSPLFQACVFQDNTAWTVSDTDGGGAVYNLGSSPTFIDCQFLANHAEANARFAGGGAMRNQSGSSPVLRGCLFSGNSATGPGLSTSGAMYNSVDAHAELLTCRFEGNQADWDGAMAIDLNSGATLEDCTFQDNVALDGGAGAIGYYSVGGTGLTAVGCRFERNIAQGRHGGAIYSEGGTDLVLLDCDFIQNEMTSNDGDSGGGAIVANDGSTVTMNNCRFIENTSAGCCGGVGFTEGTIVDVTDCSFIGNIAGGRAGGAYVQDTTQSTFTNCLFLGNQAVTGGGLEIRNLTGHADIINATFSENEASSGGGIYYSGTGTVSVSNSILWGNSPQEIVAAGGSITVRHSDVQGGTGQWWFGTGSIDTDPLLVTDPTCGGYFLSPDSPCIDAADNTAVPPAVTNDLCGNRRFVNDPVTEDTGVPGGPGGDAIVDMGAYEFPCDPCDMNCDGDINAFDIEPFLDLLFDPNARPCNTCTGDVNADGNINALDIEPFLECLFP